MSSDTQNLEFIICSVSTKEAKRRFCVEKDYYIVDIGKIIRELGYDTKSLSIESEFIINHSIQKKITQGIYNTKSEGILIIHKNISTDFVENLKNFLSQLEETFSFEVKVI
jgi:hypothetical protein